MPDHRETLEGYIVDIACLRRYPRAHWLDKARTHSRTCSLEGHCLESGYGLVGEDGSLALLDTAATLKIADLVRRSDRDQGARARVVRSVEGGEATTVEVTEIP